MAGNKNSGRRLLLTSQHRQFAALLLANGGNIQATCRSMGISQQTAYNWSKNKLFAEELARRQEILSCAANVTGAEVIGILASQMRADIADVLPDEELVIAARARGVSHLIRKIKVRTIIRRDGSEEKIVELELVDAGKAAIALSKMMGLEARDDAKERARNAIRALMDLKQCSPEEAISILAPHNPTVTQLRDEFAGTGPIIEIGKLAEGDE